MIDLAATVIRDLEAPERKDLQERMLEAMLMMERHRGVPVDVEIAPDVADADVSSPIIHRLADALEKFIRTFPRHRDVGSAIWALGRLRDPRHADLFLAVTDPSSAYNEWARDQALCALEDQGYEKKEA